MKGTKHDPHTERQYVDVLMLALVAALVTALVALMAAAIPHFRQSEPTQPKYTVGILEEGEVATPSGYYSSRVNYRILLEDDSDDLFLELEFSTTQPKIIRDGSGHKFISNDLAYSSYANYLGKFNDYDGRQPIYDQVAQIRALPDACVIGFVNKPYHGTSRPVYLANTTVSYIRVDCINPEPTPVSV